MIARHCAAHNRGKLGGSARNAAQTLAYLSLGKGEAETGVECYQRVSCSAAGGRSATLRGPSTPSRRPSRAHPRAGGGGGWAPRATYPPLFRWGKLVLGKRD